MFFLKGGLKENKWNIFLMIIYIYIFFIVQLLFARQKVYYDSNYSELAVWVVVKNFRVFSCLFQSKILADASLTIYGFYNQAIALWVAFMSLDRLFFFAPLVRKQVLLGHFVICFSTCCSLPPVTFYFSSLICHETSCEAFFK